MPPVGLYNFKKKEDINMKSLEVAPGKCVSNTISIPNNIIFGASDDGLIAFSNDDGEHWTILLDNNHYELNSKMMKYIGSGLYVISGIYHDTPVTLTADDTPCQNPSQDAPVIFATCDGTTIKELLS